MSAGRRTGVPGFAFALLFVAALAAVWLGSAELPWAARAMMSVLVVILPALLLGQATLEQGQLEELSRPGAYVTSIVAIWVLALLSWMAGAVSGFGWAGMGIRPVPLAPALAWIGAVTLFGLAVLAAGRLLGPPESPLVRWLMPRSTLEQALFLAVSLSAGIGEEFTFRGFLLPALGRASGSLWLAIILSSVAFGMMHSYQRLRGVVRATGFGIILAAPLLSTRSLIPGMIAHAMFDILAGLVLADWLIDPRQH